MGCGKSKHDVVTGNTKKVRKPSEEESVKGKENETIKRQESCRCQKTSDQPETTVENNTKKPEETETTTLPPVTAIVPENIVAEDTANNVNESVLHEDEQKEKDEIETVVEEEKSIYDQIFGDVDTEAPPSDQVEEPKPDVQTPVTMATKVEDIITTENVEIVATENDEVSVLKDEDKSDLVEENLAKEVESA